MRTQLIGTSVRDEWPIQAQFHRHLANSNRIIFSAPFGVGKTYFIQEFFKQEENKTKYEVFTVYPIHYCTAKNRDIFDLIKFDLANQLVEKGYISDSYEKKASVKKNIKRLFQFIFEGLNVVTAGSSKKVTDSVQSSWKILKAIIDSSGELPSTEDNNVLQFLDLIGEKDGVYLEMNAISEIIRNKIKGIEDKETILIIEDLDRLDPAHIFRLLNVFSAHDDPKTYENKFGFSKVMIVCDLENIRKIYNHFYGATTDFKGYIDKFCDKWPFEFDNYKAIVSYITTTLGPSLEKLMIHHELFSSVLLELAKEDKITFRDVLKLEKLNIEEDVIFNSKCRWGYDSFHSYFYVLPSVIILLSRLFAAPVNMKELFNGMQALQISYPHDLREHVIAARDFYLRECNSGIRSMGINDRPFAISDKQDQEDDVDVKAVLADIAERMGYC